MDGLLIPILIAGAVVLAVFGITKVVVSPQRGERKKLAERLSTDRPYDDAPKAPGTTSIMLANDTEGLPPALAKYSFFRRLNRTLGQVMPGMRPVRFLLICAGAAVVPFLISYLITGGMLLVPLVVGSTTGSLPYLVVVMKRNKRQKTLADQLPEALDFLSRILRAGHSFSTGLQMMGDELPKPLAAEFRRCYDQHSLGQSIDDSLRDMTTRVESPDFAFFVTAVLIQRQTGGDLSEVLNNISGMIRARIRLSQQVKAKTAEGRFTGYIMVAFPLVMFGIIYSISPENATVLTETSEGRIMLSIAGSLQLLGLFAIRKITTVKV